MSDISWRGILYRVASPWLSASNTPPTLCGPLCTVFVCLLCLRPRSRSPYVSRARTPAVYCFFCRYGSRVYSTLYRRKPVERPPLALVACRSEGSPSPNTCGRNVRQFSSLLATTLLELSMSAAPIILTMLYAGQGGDARLTSKRLGGNTSWPQSMTPARVSADVHLSSKTTLTPSSLQTHPTELVPLYSSQACVLSILLWSKNLLHTRAAHTVNE